MRLSVHTKDDHIACFHAITANLVELTQGVANDTDINNQRLTLSVTYLLTAPHYLVSW
jgi:hypothetical protein